MNWELVLTIIQWILVGVAGVSFVFGVLFYVRYLSSHSNNLSAGKKVKEQKESVEEVESEKENVVVNQITIHNYAKEENVGDNKEVSDSTDLDEMLARLEAKAIEVSRSEENVEEDTEDNAEDKTNQNNESSEELNEEKTAKNIDSEVVDESLFQEETEEGESIESIRRKALEKIEARRKAEQVEQEAEKENIEEVSQDVSSNDDEEMVVVEDTSKEEPKPEKEEVIIKVVAPDAHAIDYETRLATIKENYAKIERDYNKNHNSVLKYERTERRKVRNEKLLNKKATELTNLNLVLYNVKDLKNVDPEKKARQEEIANHIAELKESIKSADKYIVENATKYENAKKFDAFLEKEKQRYEIEIKELEDLIKKGNK